VVDILTGIHNVSIVLSTRSRVIHRNVHSADGKKQDSCSENQLVWHSTLVEFGFPFVFYPERKK
jgi:hypothetical protein